MLSIPGLSHLQVSALLLQIAALTIALSAVLLMIGFRRRAGQLFLVGCVLAIASAQE